MKICLDCGCLFDEPVEYVETHGFDTPPYEHFSGCPECYGAYVNAHECDCCHKWIVGDYVKIKNKRYCDNCFCNMEIGDEE